jgi:hypothetical protein
MSLSRYLSKLAALVGSDGKVPAAGLASGAAVSNIGYTPLKTQGTRFSGDLNTLGVSDATTGVYAIDASPTNAAIPNSYGTLLAMFSVDLGIQYHFTYGGKIYWRKYTQANTTWTAWKQIVDVDGIEFTGAINGRNISNSLSTSSYSEAIRSNANQTPSDAYPGYGFHKIGVFGTFLYAESHLQLLLKGDNGSTARMWNSANFPEPLGEGSVTGSFSANTWYTLANAWTIDVGSYLLIARVNTYNAGGGSYNEVYSGIFSQGQIGTNSGQSDTIPMVKGGHAPNYEQLSFRYQRSTGNTGATIQWQSTASLSLDNSGGKSISYRILRLASI